MADNSVFQEKNLKKTFIIATLVSTIISCFGNAQGLYDRLAQKKVDKKQDAEIKKLQEQVNSKSKDADDAKTKSDDGRSRQGERRRGGSPDSEDLHKSLQRSGRIIQNTQRFYEDDLYRMDRRLQQRFEMGDMIAQNELQAQIIQLQQTVINILEQAVYTGQQPSRADMVLLFQASEAARQGTVDALSGQYHRLIQGGELQRSRTAPMKAIEGPPSLQSSRRGSVQPSLRGLPEPDPLYCRYAAALQDYPGKQLAASFSPGGNCACESCGVRLPIVPGRAFQIYKEDSEVRGGEARYHILNRFMVKCHRPNGEFACVLCTRNRKVDTIWEDLRAFAKHVSRAHDANEYFMEIDIEEVD